MSSAGVPMSMVSAQSPAKPLNGSGREVIEVPPIDRADEARHVVPVLVRDPCHRPTTSDGEQPDGLIRQRRTEHALVGVDLRVGGVIHRDEARRIQVCHFFERVREADGQPALRIRDQLATLDAHPLVGVRTPVAARGDEFAENARAERVGDELEALAVPREEGRARVDVE